MQVLKTKSSEGFVIKDFKSRDFKILLFYYYYFLFKQGIALSFFCVKQTSFENDKKSFLILKDKAFTTKSCFLTVFLLVSSIWFC